MNPMNDIATRELGVFEIMRETLKLYKLGFKHFVPLCLFAFIPVNLIELFTPAYSVVISSDPFQTISAGSAVSLLFSALVRHVFTCLVTGGFTYAALCRYAALQQPQTPITHAFAKWPALIITGLVFYMFIGISSFLIFPAIYFGILFMFHQNIAAISGEKGMKALVAASALVRGKMGKRALYAAAFVVIQFGITALITFVLGGFYPSGASLTIAGGAATVVLNVLTETVGSVVILAQCVWFINIIMMKNTLFRKTEEKNKNG